MNDLRPLLELLERYGSLALVLVLGLLGLVITLMAASEGHFFLALLYTVFTLFILGPLILK